MKKIIFIVVGVVVALILGRLIWAFWQVNQGGVTEGDIKVDVGSNVENNSVLNPPALP